MPANLRIKAMLVPREHGAWGMLLVPLATGAAVASRSSFKGTSLLVFVVATMSLFWLRTPVEAWLGTSAIKAQTTQERRVVAQLTVLLSALSLVSVGVLFATGYARGLLAIGAVAGLALLGQVGVKQIGRNGRMPAQIVGAIGLTSTAAGAYYVTSGRLDATLVALWLANWLFAADQIHYVQIRIRAGRATNWRAKLERGRWFLLAQLGLLGVLIAAGKLNAMPWLVLVAFVPVLLRGLLWFVAGNRRLDVHKLGFSELAQSLVFGALLTAAFMV